MVIDYHFQIDGFEIEMRSVFVPCQKIVRNWAFQTKSVAATRSLADVVTRFLDRQLGLLMEIKFFAENDKNNLEV